MGLEDDLRDASGDVATIKKLLTERADVNSKDSGVRNLFVSCLQILPPCFPHSQHMRFATCVQGLACISGTHHHLLEGREFNFALTSPALWSPVGDFFLGVWSACRV